MTMPPTPDVDGIISRCLAGDDSAFNGLHAAFAARVKTYLLRRGFTAADADDLSQDVFTRVFKSFDTFDPVRGTFAQWLFTIAKNVARRRRQRLAAPEHCDAELAERVFDEARDPGEAAALQERIARLSECIDLLPEHLVNMIHLRYVAARTTRGVAAATGIPQTTVRLRLEQAFRELIRCLKSKGIFE